MRDGIARAERTLAHPFAQRQEQRVALICYAAREGQHFGEENVDKICEPAGQMLDVVLHDLRARIGYVPQKGMLFSGTIESNLKYGGENISDADMQQAADIAQATEFIDSKVDRYNSLISQGGTNVSGGQKQRLSIARAIAKHPKIYLFDDSFSALDYKTDLTLRKELSKQTADATVIIVAQRISTILHADNILVLDEGKIVGSGTHEELLASCETYQEIAKSQLSEAELAGVEKGGRA